MPRKQRDTGKKRDSIIDAATKAFRQKGYEATSMDQIADIAGASKRTVYNHFGSKTILFQAVIDRAVAELSSLKQITYDSTQSLEMQLEQFADAKLASVQNPAWLNLTRVVLSVFIQNPQLARETIAKAESDDDALVSWLKAATADKRLTVEDVGAAAAMFWAMVTGAFIWPVVFTGELEPLANTKLKREIIETFLSRYRV